MRQLCDVFFRVLLAELGEGIIPFTENYLWETLLFAVFAVFRYSYVIFSDSSKLICCIWISYLSTLFLTFSVAFLNQ